jgi:riboflavin synthase
LERYGVFTGIIETTGVVTGVRPAPPSAEAGHATRLDVRLGGLLDGLALGASVAVNGVCLTLAARQGDVGGFDVVPETWRRSNLQHVRPGTPVNLERALRVGDRLDGHFVQGHVDGLGTADELDRGGGEWKQWVATTPDVLAYIVPKGSVALDGVSLTVVDVTPGRFSVALIPTTLRATTLGERRPGDLLNIETDILARTVLHRLGHLAAGETGGVTWEQLRAAGFVS